MPKRKQEKPQRKFTKRQLARWEQEKRRQRIIFGSVILVIVAVVSIMGVGFYTTSYQPLHETVITVNDTRFDMNYYLTMLRYFGQSQTVATMPGIANQVVNIIEQNELVRQGAAALGIVATNSEVDQALAKTNPPLSKDYRDIVRGQVLIKKLTDEYFDTKVPTSAGQRQVLAMLLESESQALDVRAQLEAGKDFGELATSLTRENVSKTKKGDLGWHPQDALALVLNTSVPADQAFESSIGVLSLPVSDDAVVKSVGYWLVKIEKIPDTGEIHLFSMLLGSEQQAKQVKARLDAGEEFAKLAGEFSVLDNAKVNGGDMGIVKPGMLSTPLDAYVFKTQPTPEGLSNPIRDDQVTTKGGYWLVRAIAEEDNRPLSDDDRKLLKDKALNDWFLQLRLDPANKVESFLDDSKIQWAVARVTGSKGQ